MVEILIKITVFLLAVVFTVPIAKYLKLGSVLGYLIAGAAIGPFALGFLAGQEQHSLHEVSEFGVVMMLFLIGLELKPSMLWKLKVPIFGLGGLQMLLCTLAIGGLAYALGENKNTAIAIGMILALSSTAIVVQTLSEKNLLTSKGGRSTFSVLLFQDISVIPMFAILPFLMSSEFVRNNVSPEKSTAIAQWIAEQPKYVHFLSIFGVLIFIIVVGRYLASYIFRFIVKTGIRDLFTAIALLMVSGVALLMDIVGLSAALGTFVAGVMLAESEYRHEIELSLEPFKGLLLGLFFITVGASIDFNLLKADSLSVCRWVFLLVCVKFLILFIVAKMFRHKSLQALLFACSLAQGGEFAFVLIAFCLQNQILTNEQGSFYNLVITLSMTLMPVLMIAYDAVFSHHTRRRAKADNTDMADDWENNEIIIVGCGRFSTTIWRFLMANGKKCTILDINPNIIDTVRRFGEKVYYGDATNPEVLKLAGADKAKLLIIGLTNPDTVKQIINNARKNFPKLKIFARANDIFSSYNLMDLKVDYFQRELFLSAIDIAEKSLIALGLHPHNAWRRAKIFRDYDEKTILKLYADWDKGSEKGREQLISKSRALRQEISSIMLNDRTKKLSKFNDHAWEPPPTETELIERAIQEQMAQTKAKKAVEKAVAEALATAAFEAAGKKNSEE